MLNHAFDFILAYPSGLGDKLHLLFLDGQPLFLLKNLEGILVCL